MHDPENDHDLHLLHTDHGKLVVTYREMISCIVQHIMIDSGIYRFSEKPEKIQEVTARLFERIERVKKNYSGKAKLRTYLAAVIRNICREISREELTKNNSSANHDPLNPESAKTRGFIKRFTFLPVDENQMVSGSHETDKMAILHSEFERMDLILSTYGRKRLKLELCLKSWYKIPVDNNHVSRILRQKGIDTQESAFRDFFEELNSGPEEFNKQDVCKLLTRFFNHCEQHLNSPDAIRKFIDTKINELLQLMNGNPPQAGYNKSNLVFFLELYYQWKSEKKFQKSSKK